MAYILVGLVSFFVGYALCLSYVKRDVINGKPMVFNGDVYVASKK